MIKSILVPATGGGADAAVFSAALAVARAFEAHLDFLHVRVDAAAVAVGMASDGAGAALVGGLIERLEQEADQREARAKQFFDGFCQQSGLAIVEVPAAAKAASAQWHRETGSEADWLAEYGRAADLLVVGRPQNGDGVAGQTLEAALLQTGRPLLIPTGAGFQSLPDIVAIAWKAVPEAARAVAAAMPLLRRAKSVVILGVEEGGASAGGAEDRLAAGLAWHGLDVTVQRLRAGGKSAPEALLAAAGERAGLLVMGGYGHSRLREFVFGGFTARALRVAPLPLLIAH